MIHSFCHIIYYIVTKFNVLLSFLRMFKNFVYFAAVFNFLCSEFVKLHKFVTFNKAALNKACYFPANSVKFTISDADWHLYIFFTGAMQS